MNNYIDKKKNRFSKKNLFWPLLYLVFNLESLTYIYFSRKKKLEVLTKNKFYNLKVKKKFNNYGAGNINTKPN